MENKTNNPIEPDGVLIIDKHAGVTSHDIIGAVRRLYGTRRVGHTGTLDPMATGVLVVLVGRAAKAAEYIQSDGKRYIAGMKLGVETDTEDTTGTLTGEYSGVMPAPDKVFEACGKFVGDIMQVPPMYSAIKVGGRKLYELARAGETIDIAARPVTIYSLDASEEDINESIYRLDVVCSGGTYIRSLCRDIGAALGCGGAMCSLRRMRSGRFDISAAHTVAQIEEMSADERLTQLMPTETLFAELDKVQLSDFYARLAHSGAEIYQKKIKTEYPVGVRVRLYDADGFFAIGEAMDYEEGSALKPIKTFRLQ
ncbi:MAG: tRNA pseudouridine(55) synthase TruB [Eubacteriales bacterium]